LHIIKDVIAARCMEDPPQPIAAMAPELTVYLTSLSKTVAPGLRIRFLHSPESF
jgi:DNA-binding transcriptional MocR family regulator